MIESLFINILSMSTIASIVFLLILLTRKCINNKVNKENSSLLWIIFIIVLIIPLKFQSNLSIKNFIKPDKTFTLTETKNFSNLTLNKDDVVIQNKSNENINIMGITSVVWFGIAIIYIIADALIYKSINTKTSFDISENILKILNDCKKDLNIKKKIQIVVQDKVNTPSLYGIFNTKILLTKDILNFSENELKCIITHELNHYKRKHHILYIIFNLVERIHWFNPIVKTAFKIIKQDMEIITDNTVLKANVTVKEYCKTIIKITELCNLKEIKMPSICSGKKDIERRIMYMKNKCVKNSIFVIVVAIIILSIITISLASDKVENPNADNINTEDINIENAEIINEIFNEINNQKDIPLIVEYIVPVEYTKISARFGTRIHPITKKEMTHTGIDLVAEEGTKVKAAADGIVEVSTYDAQKGNYVEIKHIDGSVSAYCHGLDLLVQVGDNVKVGDYIMTVGKTGAATGAHLHFEVRNANNEYMDVNKMVEGY